MIDKCYMHLCKINCHCFRYLTNEENVVNYFSDFLALKGLLCVEGILVALKVCGGDLTSIVNCSLTLVFLEFDLGLLNVVTNDFVDDICVIKVLVVLRGSLVCVE